jgi:hypothetical protein
MGKTYAMSDEDEALRQHLLDQERKNDRYFGKRFKDFYNLSTQEPYAYEFGELFIEAMLKPNFTHIRRDSQGFDIIAYRTSEDDDKVGYTPFHTRRDPEKYPEIPFWGYNRIYGFELKTAHDDPWRFMTQLPRYCWCFDVVYIVLAEGVKVPSRLPKWVGVFKQKGKEFSKIREARDTFAFLGTGSVDLSKLFVPQYQGQASPSFRSFISFLRKIFLNGVFKEPIEPFNQFDRGLVDILYYIERSHRPRWKGRDYIDPDESDYISFDEIVKVTRKLIRGGQMNLKQFIQEESKGG